MSYFQNPLFVATLIRRQGVEGYFQNSEMISLLIYVEMETRLLIETAVKYMKKGRRNKLERQDIELAAQYIGHQDITFPILAKRLVVGDSHIPISKLAQSCGFNISNRIQSAKLKGRVLFKEGKISDEFSNRPIRQLRREQLYLTKGSGIGQFNMIYFNQHQILSAQEVIYLGRFQQILLDNRPKLIISLDGNITKMFTMFLNLIRYYPNEAGIRLLQELIGHPLATQAIVSYHLMRILEILLVYRGTWAYQVGNIIAKLVSTHLKQQPALIRLMEVSNDDYSFVLKAIAFQEHFQIDSLHCRLQPVLERALKESNKGNQMAIICFRTMLQKSTKLQAFHKQKVYVPFWIPTEWTTNDRQLSQT